MAPFGVTRAKHLAFAAAPARALTVSAAVWYALHGSPVLAAEPQMEAESEANGLQEVMVTARRRAEDIRNVPISITAVSAQSLKDNNITNLDELQTVTPGLSFRASQDRDAPLITMRGQVPNRGSGPSVVVYMDEVPMPLIQDTGGSLGGPGFFYDLEGAEVLKGPQGTLFGRNTTGGAILLKTARPKDQFEGSAQVTVGDYNDREFDGVLNGPVADGSLLARLAVSMQKRDGFTNVIGVSGHALDDVDRKSARLSLTYKFSDSVKNDLIASIEQNQSNGQSLTLYAVRPSADYPTLAALFAQQTAAGIRNALPTDGALDRHRHFWSATDILQVDITPNLTFRNIAGFSRVAYAFGTDWDGTNLPIFQFYQGTPSWRSYEYYTEEAQLQGKALSGNLTYTVGLFYLDSPEGPFQGSSTVVLGSPSFTNTRTGSVSKAVYAQGTYDLSSLAKGLDVTVGYRQSKDRNATAVYNASDLTGACPQPCTILSNDATYSAPSWNLTFDYHTPGGTLVYLASRRSFRDGGFNMGNARVAASPYAAYGPEYVHDYELGTKGLWSPGDVKVQTNAAVYVSDYSDIQISTVVDINGRPTPVVANSAKAQISGVEFDTTILATKHLQFGASASWVNFKNQQASAGVSVPTDHTFPRWEYSANVRYSRPLPGTLGEAGFNVNWSGQTHTYLGFLRNPLLPTSYEPGYGLLSLSADWNHINGSPVDLTVFGTNLLDKNYRVFATNIITFTPVATATWGDPRMYGMRLSYKF